MSRYSSKKEKRGVLDVDALFVDGKSISPAWAGSEMFEADISSFEKRIDELNLTHLLDYEEMGRLDATDIEEQAVNALGADCAEITSFSKKNNEAWFLVNFLRYRLHLRSEETKTIIDTAIGLGRLIEWWRWRTEGYDNDAVIGGKNKEARDKADAAKAPAAADRQADMEKCIITLWNEIKGKLEGKKRRNFLKYNNYAAGLIHDEALKTNPPELLILKTKKIKSAEVIRKLISELKDQEKIS